MLSQARLLRPRKAPLLGCSSKGLRNNRGTCANHCPICQARGTVTRLGTWDRDQRICSSCESVPRERAVALEIGRLAPLWYRSRIHEASPADRGLSKILRKAPGYFGSNLFPDESSQGGLLHIDLQNQNLSENSVDLFVALDVLEHVYDPGAVFREIHRTLSSRGLAVLTFPIQAHQASPLEQRATQASGETLFLKPPIFHGNPISAEGSLVTVDYGIGIEKVISDWAPFAVERITVVDDAHGVTGEYTDVVICRPAK
jgi:hypothetical protein